MRRFILEMGMGNDLHGCDATKAAGRAIETALRRSTLPLFETLGLDHAEMEVRVTVAVPDPAGVDCTALAARLPRGRATVRAVEGGLAVRNPDTGETAIVATAAVEAFLDPATARAAAARGRTGA
ncbi:Lin0512 family protein [Jannaschia sp. W003]|uniref:Lin0512 family protein n=1 Tax=Jannaschia sp. W003 TaxID=2867012 RepID=UPI0021A42581|nr:Lin0512 family protein [Jannaschia sp. W003]UWQ22540.1 Lin0512 family protein [Jannaschia sp. W003]